MRHARRGFTLLEMLVVIGIILVLIGMIVMGYRHIDAATSRKATVAQLHVLRGIQTEYERQNGLKYLEGPPPQTTTIPPLPIYVDVPANGTPVTKPPCYIQLGDLMTGQSSDMSDKSAVDKPRYACQALMRTQYITPFLARMPANRTLMANLPSQRILEPPPGTTAGSNVFENPTTHKGIVVLDGWSNPIIYVPAGGIVVNIADPTTKAAVPWIVRSTGTQRLTSPKAIPPMTGNERPFWASAGQDADFTKGEDNVYSFQD